jgi:uncharacterized protein DUF4154
VLLSLIAALWLTATEPAGSTAAEVTVPALKAAFLYNFVKLTEWPADAAPPGAALRLCIVGDEAVADALEETVRRRTVDDRAVVVPRIATDAAARRCHLLYLGGLEARRSRQLVDAVKDAPVLTVSDGDTFAQQGGVASFFFEGSKLRFAVNVEAAQRAGLHLSSRLLSLAKLVKDDRNVQH